MAGCQIYCDFVERLVWGTLRQSVEGSWLVFAVARLCDCDCGSGCLVRLVGSLALS